MQSLEAIKISEFIDKLTEINDKKICLQCGEEYDSDNNFCSYHEDPVKLVSVSYLNSLDKSLKICPKCGETYAKDNNFCSFHEDIIKLVPVGDLDIHESVKIIDIETRPNPSFNIKTHLNTFETVEEIISPENINKLKSLKLTQRDYENIIDHIIRTYQNNMINTVKDYSISFTELSLLDKLILFAKSFVRTYYKSGGNFLGRFEFNEIYIDDRLDMPKKITTIIHELSHFLLAEILEQIVMISLDSQKTDAIEAFVCYRLQTDFNSVIDEFCAHSVEGRYAEYGFQDYGSYETVGREFLNMGHSKEELDKIILIGNTFAGDIERIMQSFIDADFKSQIIGEFAKSKENHDFKGVQYETTTTYPWDEFKKAIEIMLAYIECDFDVDKLNRYLISFRESNNE